MILLSNDTIAFRVYLEMNIFFFRVYLNHEFRQEFAFKPNLELHSDVLSGYSSTVLDYTRSQGDRKLTAA